MKIVLGILLVLAIVGGLSLAFIKYRLSTVTDKHNLTKSIDKEVNKFTKKSARVSLMVGVYKEGETYTNAYSGKETPENQRLDDNSVFQIGSLSKLFTASILQVLIDEKIVKLDSTLEDLIGDSNDLSEKAKSITLRQLATHTSGLPRVPDSLMKKVTQSAGKKNILIDPYSHIDVNDVAEYLKTTTGIKKPGKFAYSNFGMGLLGHVLEHVTGSDLESLAKEKLFSKLDMASTGITIDASIEKNLIPGYTAKGQKTGIWTFGALGGAGAFYSTMDDMMKYLKANIESEYSLSSSLHSMQDTNSIGWMKAGYLEKYFGNGSFLWHDGMVGGYSSYIAVDKENKTGVVILSNNAIDVSMLGAMLILQTRTQSWAAADS